MFFYYFIFICASAVASFYEKRMLSLEENGYVISKSYKVLVLFLVIALPTIILCIRSGIGIDYSNYYRYFEKYKDASIHYFIQETGSYEIINLFIIKMIYKIGGAYKVCFAVYGLLTNIFFGLTIIHYRKQVEFSYAIYILYLVMFPEMTNVVRQMLAVSIIMFSLKYCEQQKLIKFIICVLAATLIHNSAVICLLFYLVYLLGKDIHSIRAKILILLLIAAPFFVGYILDSLSTIGLFSKYYAAYDLSDSGSSSATIILRIIAYLPAIVFIRENTYKDENNKYLYYFMLMDIAFIFMGSVQKWGFRFAYYTMFIQVLTAAMCIKSQDNNYFNRVVLKVFYVIYYMLLFYILYYVWGRSGIFPYMTIWN